MQPVKIDISELVGAFDVSREEVEGFSSALVKRMASRFVYDLRSEANSRLRKTRETYKRGIIMTPAGGGAVMVELIGFLPNAVEAGLSPFDMKIGFAQSEKAVRKLDGGWYLTIPLGHASSGALGEAETLGDPMPESVWQVAKKLGAGQSLQSGLAAKGKRDKIIMKSKVFEEYVHKSDKYAGMRKSSKTGHAGYTTFRRVSDKSDNDSFIHSGIDAHNLFESAFNETNILHEIDLARDEFLGGLGL